MLYQKQLETRYQADVLVVGGGAAGVAAAVAAARMGQKVLLCEAGGCFGGVGTSGMVPSFAPFYEHAVFRHRSGDPPERIQAYSGGAVLDAGGS